MYKYNLKNNIFRHNKLFKKIIYNYNYTPYIIQYTTYILNILFYIILTTVNI